MALFSFGGVGGRVRGEGNLLASSSGIALRSCMCEGGGFFLADGLLDYNKFVSDLYVVVDFLCVWVGWGEKK